VADSGGFFGPDRLYHYWQLQRFKDHQKLDWPGKPKLTYWLFKKEMKEHQDRAETRRRAKIDAKRS